MKPAIVFADLELWLTGWLRPQLPNCRVGNQLVDGNGGHRFALAVVDDSGPDGWVTAQRRVSITARGPSAASAGELARFVASRIRQTAEAPGPVAAVGAIFGPHRVPDPSEASEFYLSVELALVGAPAPSEPTYDRRT